MRICVMFQFQKLTCWSVFTWYLTTESNLFKVNTQKMLGYRMECLVHSLTGGGNGVVLWLPNCAADVVLCNPHLSLAQMSTSLQVHHPWWQQAAWWQPFKVFISKPRMPPCPPRTSPTSCHKSFAVTRYANTRFTKPLIYYSYWLLSINV